MGRSPAVSSWLTEQQVIGIRLISRTVDQLLAGSAGVKRCDRLKGKMTMKSLKCCHVRFACLLLAVAALTTAACSAPQAMQNAPGLPATSAPVTVAPTSMLTSAHTPGVAAKPATTTIPTAVDSPLETPPAGPTATSAGTLVGQPFTSPIATPLPPISGTWRVFTLPVGVSFEYPADWQAVPVHPFPTTGGERFGIAVRPSGDPPRPGLGIYVYPLPPAQEPTLYRRAGNTWTYRESPVFHVVWDKAVSANGLDWHLDITGYIDITGTGRADLDHLASKGALTNGTLRAIHYDKKKELAVELLTGLDPNMLIALDEQGPDAIFPGRVRVFTEMLETVSTDP